ncbi:hypothetical protein BDW74DRAFT_107147 [Aspergillus multicolor]|uniref:uncharacterized protein n=1 Tax=Aspergillus multicolor TaxID=41759 RepID=UPI003CCDD15D
MHNCVMEYAKGNHEDRDCKTFLSLLKADRYQPLHGADYGKLELSYQKICATLLRQAKIISTTLANASSPGFRDKIKPGVLVCIDANRCTEGELSIALTMQSLRVVILVGDTKRPQPAVASLSARYENEGARFLARPLMMRLRGAGYPCTTLTSEKRDHERTADLHPSKNLCAAPVRIPLPLQPHELVAPMSISTLAQWASTRGAEGTLAEQKQDVSNELMTSPKPEERPLRLPPHVPITLNPKLTLIPWTATSNTEETKPIERKQGITNDTVPSQGTPTGISSTTERAATPGVPPDNARLLRIKKAALKFQTTRRQSVEDELATGFRCGTSEPLTQEDRVARERECNSLKLAEGETKAEIELYEEILRGD